VSLPVRRYPRCVPGHLFWYLLGEDCPPPVRFGFQGFHLQSLTDMEDTSVLMLNFPTPKASCSGSYNRAPLSLVFVAPAGARIERVAPIPFFPVLSPGGGFDQRTFSRAPWCRPDPERGDGLIPIRPHRNCNLIPKISGQLGPTFPYGAAGLFMVAPPCRAPSYCYLGPG